jgi:hypothetical protein
MRPMSGNVLREYLGTLAGKSASTYKNCLSAFKIDFRDFQKCDWLMESFKFPRKESYIPRVSTMHARITRAIDQGVRY